MKKLLLSSAAVCGLVAFAATPAHAQLEVSVGGHTKNYVGWLDQDTITGSEERSFDMLRESELHFDVNGVADNGLEYGFHVEMEVDAGDESDTIEESYFFLSGDWGRVNLGSEDGANYLLQVAAPSADSNIDGIRQTIQPVNYSILTDDAALNTALNTAINTRLGGIDYDNDATGFDEKITYLSPVMNGFQGGLSYTPEVGDSNSPLGLEGFNEDDQEDDLGDAYEAALRYEGTFNNVGLALGGGYTHIDIEEDTNNSSDDFSEWNIGVDLDIGAFGIGAVYTEAEDGTTADVESETYVFGVDYTTGPFKLGASYLYSETDAFNGTGGVTGDAETDRYTGGVIYTAAPGLTFRGTISHIEHDFDGVNDAEATSVLGGVQLNF